MMGISFLILALTIAVEVCGHGRLMQPPARNAMWRYGFRNPVNYNDNELYCGGFIVHYQKNGGKCGVCGDNYADKSPRMHEAGGTFGNGIMVRRYVVGQHMQIEVDLTQNHNGWMEVKLCPNNDPKKKVTQECLDRHPLQLVDGPDHKFVIPDDAAKVVTFNWTVRLPDHLTCTQCVVQWTYFAGNTWGACTDGTGSVGCGEQETFINCADVEIYSNTANIGGNLVDNPWQLYYRGDKYQGLTKSTEKDLNVLQPLILRAQLCIPIGKYENVTGMDDWCMKNCLQYPPNCPEHACKCVYECKAVGEFALEADSDIYCNQHCLGFPSVCPKDKCTCF